jgi:hypothetical protein
LQDLLEDRRFVTMRRHLRQVYVNPMSGQADWEMLVAPDGGIKGVAVHRQVDDAAEKIERSFVFTGMLK